MLLGRKLWGPSWGWGPSWQVRLVVTLRPRGGDRLELQPDSVSWGPEPTSPRMRPTTLPKRSPELKGLQRVLGGYALHQAPSLGELTPMVQEL